MIDIEDQRIVDYYAEWIKETDPSLFVMTDNQLTDEDNLSITRFEGKNKDMDALVIPSSIGGKAITSIQSGAFSGLNIDRLFLPPCLGRIQKNAFSNCDIRSIYFFDSLGFIDNEAFGSPYGIAEVHINAFEKPRFRSTSDNAIFSDDIERIISAKGKKKMVFFGGCSMSYGLDSEMIQERFPEYAVANCGVIGGCNADFQLSIISSFLEEGDIFVHAPEEMSEYQLLMNLDAENRMFVCVEGNYDLLSLCDCSRYRDFFLEYDTYVQTRKDLPASDYEEINLNYNGYGDYALPRVHQDYVRVSESMFRLDAFEDASVSRMNAYYDLFEDKDVTSVFSFAPLSADRQSEDELRERHAYEFEMLCHEKYDVRIISGIFDYLMPDEFFFDTEYHMTSEGARLRTSKLIDDLLASGEVENG